MLRWARPVVGPPRRPATLRSRFGSFSSFRSCGCGPPGRRPFRSQFAAHPRFRPASRESPDWRAQDKRCMRDRSISPADRQARAGARATGYIRVPAPRHCRPGIRHRTVGHAMVQGEARPWPAEECVRGVSHQYCSKTAGSCRSMAEQGNLLASRTSVLALRRRISSDDVRETRSRQTAWPQHSISNPSHPDARRDEARPFSGVSRGRVAKCMLLGPLDEGGRSSTTASLNIARAGGDLKKGRTRRPSFDAGFE